MVALELQVLSKKFDRFGWDREQGSAAQDALIRDWIEALCDFPVDEVRAACRAAVLESPNKMPNEGHVRAKIMEARRKVVERLPKHQEPERAPQSAEERRRVSEEEMAKNFPQLKRGWARE